MSSEGVSGARLCPYTSHLPPRFPWPPIRTGAEFASLSTGLLGLILSPLFLPHLDAPTTPEQPQPHLPDQLEVVNETEAEAKPSKNSARGAEVEAAHLSPSLLPAQQPTISLLYEDTADTLSVESLTLVPPVDPHSLRTLPGLPQPPTPAAACPETLDEETACAEAAGPTEH